jgi:hypothetical protein
MDGHSAKISTPIVPWPATTAGSLKACTKTAAVSAANASAAAWASS